MLTENNSFASEKEKLKIYKYQIIDNKIHKQEFTVYCSDAHCFILVDEEHYRFCDYAKSSHYGIRTPTKRDIGTFSSDTPLNYNGKVTYLLEDNDQLYVKLLQEEFAREILSCEEKIAKIMNFQRGLDFDNVIKD